MTFLKPAALAAALCLSPLLASAHDTGGIVVTDAYARSSTPMSASGAAFMVIENHTATDDRLIGAASDAAERVELHTHRTDAGGVMRMVAVPEGFAVPAGGSHLLARGGDHLMLLGLKAPLEQGQTVTLTLTFETAGPVEVAVPVDLTRRPDAADMGAGMGAAMGTGTGMGQMHGQAPSN